MSFIFSMTDAATAQDESPVDFIRAKSHLTVMGGYGIAHKGLGATETGVETVDVIFRYGRFLTGELGESWYRGRHEILVEIPVRAVVHPESAIMTGITFLAAWSFTASDGLVPYIFAGGGPVYTNLDIPGLGAELNYSYQGGAGGYYFIRKDMAANFNYRLHHMSNAGTAEPNEPLNSSRILIGLTFFR
ncbi:MAG: acyloxyacyl hydrolase [Nitrospirota bacterium]